MKKFGFAAVVASSLAAAALGFAGSAQANDEVTVPVTPSDYSAGIDHLDWLNDIAPKLNSPQVESEHQSR